LGTTILGNPKKAVYFPVEVGEKPLKKRKRRNEKMNKNSWADQRGKFQME